MSNYVVTTDFAAKDALVTGNPAKVAKGTDVATELTNIATAVATKLDITAIVASTALSYTVTGASVPTNGIYLSAANAVSLATNSLLRFTVNSNGGLTLATPTSGTAFTLNSVAAGTAINGGDGTVFYQLNTNASILQFGTSSAHNVSLYTNNIIRFTLTNVGVGSLWEGTYNVGAAAVMQVATTESGSFTGTITGCTTAPTATVFWRRNGNLVTLNMDTNLLATSNSTACTITGMPVALQPAKAQRMAVTIQDNNLTLMGSMTLNAASNILQINRGDGAAFSNTLGKGCYTFTVTYPLV